MPYPPKYHKHPRLPGNDYTRGAYFVTLCALDRRQWFGRIVGMGADAVFEPNDLGRIILDQWQALPSHFAHLRLDQVQLMPDHLHAILVLAGVGSGKALGSGAGNGSTLRVDGTTLLPNGAAPRPIGPAAGSLGAIIGAFKSGTTYAINQLHATPGQRYWQRGFHDRAIRTTQGEFERIERYIAENPKNWR